MKRICFAAARALLAGTLAAPAVWSATTQTWEMNTYQDFLRGRLRGAGITTDGRLIASPALTSLTTLKTPQIWSVAQAPKSLIAGGAQGDVWEITGGTAARIIAHLPEPQVFAVAVSPRGEVFAASSPSGKVYRIANDKAEEYFAPGSTYIWALAFAPDGSLYVATGNEGKIFHVTAKAQGEVWYETGQANVTALAFDKQGRLLAGSEPNGILYRIAEKGRAFVLYDANLPEIRTIVPAADGTIYVAALGGSVARRAGAAASSNNSGGAVTAAPISITVTDQNAQVGPEIKPKADAPKSATTSTTSTAGTVEVAGVEKSAIYRILSDNTVETLWSSKEENAYDLVLETGGTLLFATDGAGRLYRLEQNRKAALLAETGDGELTRLLRTDRDWLAAGAAGTLYRLGTAPAVGGYESPVHDSSTTSRWGKVRLVGGGARIQTRTGNSAKPDPTWSDWANTDAGGQVTSPNARYIQWRAELTLAGEIDSLGISYLPQNTPPVIRSLNVTSTVAPASKGAASGQAKQGDSFTVTVTESGESSSPAGTPSQTIGRAGSQQLQLAWQADDPDGDKLLYSVYFRGVGNPGQETEREWKLLKANLTDNALAIDGDSLADGRYLFKVVASDQPSNPAQNARESELIGAPVIIDSTPPVVTLQWAQGRLVVNAKDATSPLRRCEYAIDANPWIPIEAEDGVTDSAEERFVTTPKLTPGEHVIAVRVYDAAGNAGLGRVVVR